MILFDLSLAQVAIVLAAVLAGSCLQSSLGFGLGLLASPVLVLVEPRLVPGPLLCMALPLALLVAWRERDSLDFSTIRWAIVGRLPGSVIGAAAVAALSERWLAGLFAASILTAVGLSVRGLSVAPVARNLFAAGVVSGAMGTATSVGGPPVALVYQRVSGQELRGSLSAFMLFGGTLSVVALVLFGEFGRSDLELAVLLIPGVVIGFLISPWTTRFLDSGYTRPAVLAFATASAISILLRQVA